MPQPARDVPARAVILCAPAANLRLHGLVGIAAHPFGEHPQDGVVAIAVRAAGAADNIVVEHRLDRPALLDGVIGHQVAAKKALLFPAQQGIDDGGGVLPLRQHPRGLEYQRAAAGVVVRAGGVDIRIHHVAGAAVDMGLHDHHLVGPLAPALDGNDIADQHACGNAVAGYDAFRVDDLQAILAGSVKLIEAGRGPAPCRANAAQRILD